MIDYSWVPWFKELVRLIAEHDERWLVKRAKAVDWGTDKVHLLEDGYENIDPLSFLYFLAQRKTNSKFERVFRSVHNEFGISVKFPSMPYIPVPPNNARAVYYERGGGHSIRSSAGGCSGKRLKRCPQLDPKTLMAH